ncbi:MAG: carboxypeptidase-like regulatory domain-containing protein [Planctomycetota bacterium]|nr:carboxypeptidase-like regulatory domain-containing protein [Planctomycetota bacterium]
MIARFNKSAMLALSLSLIVIVSVSVGGCGKRTPPYGKIAGRVTMNGKPVNHGSITFTGEGVGSMYNLGPDGEFEAKSYDLPGLPVGKYKVAISPLSYRTSKTVENIQQNPNAGAAAKVEVPVKYHSAETSGLTIDVVEGENPPFNRDLKP